MDEERRHLDKEAVEKFSEKMWGNIGGAMTMSLCFLGERLGLYHALAEKGPVTSHDLAEHTGLDERWLREWLYQQACAGVIAHTEPTRFYLEPEAIEVLVNDESMYFVGGSLVTVMELARNAPNLQDSFRTGIGLSYDALGLDCAVGLDRMGGSFRRQRLIPELLPLLDGVIEKLEDGALVADVGCGVGTAPLLMAEAFPKSEFHGYDTSLHALAEARRHTDAAGLTNLFWHSPFEESLPQDNRFDFVTAFDVVHDTINPTGLLDAVYNSIKPDGTWLITDVAGKSSFEDNRNDHPLATILYGFSVLLCMSAGLSEPGGAGMGTLGFHEEAALQMTKAAGFTRFRKLEFDDAFNNHYEVRP